MLVGTCAPAAAQPRLNIGINLQAFPDLVPVPDYPVYYAPQLDSNYFFYDGLYWVYDQDRWYSSSWYDGPWDEVPAELVPSPILLVPVRYYRRPPVYFRDWAVEAPPRWGEHWGRGWEQSRRGWDHWDRASAPAPAPLPMYQRAYSGNRYPSADQQSILRQRNYNYQPRETVTRQRYQLSPGARIPETHRSNGNALPQAERAPPQQQRNPAFEQRQRQSNVGLPQQPQPSQSRDQNAPRYQNPSRDQNQSRDQKAPRDQNPSRDRNAQPNPPANAPAQQPKQDQRKDRDHGDTGKPPDRQ